MPSTVCTVNAPAYPKESISASKSAVCRGSLAPGNMNRQIRTRDWEAKWSQCHSSCLELNRFRCYHPARSPFRLQKGCLTCGFHHRGNVMESVALFCTRTLQVMDLGWLTEVVGQRRREQFSGDWRFPIFSCNSFHKFIHSECIITKQ